VPLQNTFKMVTVEESLKNSLTLLDVFALFVAALCHDMDHNGTNNTYHINTWSRLSLRYNDISVLEQHHASLTFKVGTVPRGRPFVSRDLSIGHTRSIFPFAVSLLATGILFGAQRLLFSEPRGRSFWGPEATIFGAQRPLFLGPRVRSFWGPEAALFGPRGRSF
jgi:hypothetical protein